MTKQFIIEAKRLQKLAGITEAKVVPTNNTTYKWDKEINQLLSLYPSGNDNEYELGYEHEFNINVELNTDDDLIPFYNFLKTKPNKTYIRPFKIPSVSVTANTEYEDEDLGDLIVKFTEPENWPIGDIDEAKVVPGSTNKLFPMLTSDSTEESAVVDYNNLAKNIKMFKPLIANKLKSYSLDKDTLDRFLINYANNYIETEHAGEAYNALYNITLQEWLDDIVANFEDMYEEDEEIEYEPDPNYDELTIDDIR